MNPIKVRGIMGVPLITLPNVLGRFSSLSVDHSWIFSSPLCSQSQLFDLYGPWILTPSTFVTVRVLLLGLGMPVAAEKLYSWSRRIQPGGRAYEPQCCPRHLRGLQEDVGRA